MEHLKTALSQCFVDIETTRTICDEILTTYLRNPYKEQTTDFTIRQRDQIIPELEKEACKIEEVLTKSEDGLEAEMDTLDFMNFKRCERTQKDLQFLKNVHTLLRCSPLPIALHWAILAGNPDEHEMLCRLEMPEYSSLQLFQKEEFLEYAVQHGQLKVVEKLLQQHEIGLKLLQGLKEMAFDYKQYPVALFILKQLDVRFGYPLSSSSPSYDSD